MAPASLIVTSFRLARQRAVGRAAQGGNDEDAARARQCRDEPNKIPACGLARGAGEQLLELVNDEQELRFDRSIVALLGLEACRHSVEGSQDRRGRRAGRARKRRRQLLRAREIAFDQLRQGPGPEQRVRERALGGCGCARPHHRETHQIDAVDVASLRQARHQPGTRKRGFSGTARPHYEQEGGAARGCREQPFPPTLGLPLAAEEHLRMLRLVGFETAERRAALGNPPNDLLAEQPALVQPGAQMTLKQLLELVGPAERLKAGAEVTLLRHEPLPPERFEGIELSRHQTALCRVGDRDAGVGHLAIDQDVGKSLLLLGLEGERQLVDGAARKGTAVRHGAEEIGRQLGTQLGPEDADHEIKFAGIRDLLLEALVGGEVFLLVLEEDRLDGHVLAEAALQPIDDQRGALAFRHDIGRRGNEHRDFADRPVRHVARSVSRVRP